MRSNSRAGRDVGFARPSGRAGRAERTCWHHVLDVDERVRTARLLEQLEGFEHRRAQVLQGRDGDAVLVRPGGAGACGGLGADDNKLRGDRLALLDLVGKAVVADGVDGVEAEVVLGARRGLADSCADRQGPP